MLTIHIPIDPPRVTHQQKKVAIINGKPRFYEPKRLKEARRELMDYIAPQRPQMPLTGPLKLEVDWRFKAITHKPGEWKETKPDTDNLDKLLKDVMTACRIWKDDAQVCFEVIRKSWEKEPGIIIKVEELSNADQNT